MRPSDGSFHGQGSPNPIQDGVVLLEVFVEEYVNAFPYIARELDESHPSLWQRVSNDPRAGLE